MDGSEQTLRKMRGTTVDIQQAARAMRREMTPAEALLWQAISGRRLGGLRFRAQHPVGQFILDFYCPICKLVIEVDGSVHKGRDDQDAARTAYLNAYGYQVLRCRNEEIVADLPSVLDRILRTAETIRPGLLPTPL